MVTARERKDEKLSSQLPCHSSYVMVSLFTVFNSKNNINNNNDSDNNNNNSDHNNTNNNSNGNNSNPRGIVVVGRWSVFLVNWFLLDSLFPAQPCMCCLLFLVCHRIVVNGGDADAGVAAVV